MYNANMTKYVIWINVSNVLRKGINIAKG